MIVTCLLCGLKEEHEARGLGARCYRKVRLAGQLSRFPRGRRAPAGKRPERREYYRLYKRAWYARKKAA
jgi:hypothetical protein